MKLFETKIKISDALKAAEIIESGDMGFGPNVPKFEEAYKDYSSKRYNVAVNSASAAAFIIFAKLKSDYGSCDVYTTSIGFTSVAWAAKHHGHNLIFVDVTKDMLFDVDDYRCKRKWRAERYSDGGVTPVIMPVLYGGVTTIPGFDRIKEDGYNEIVVVDSAHCSKPDMESWVSFFSFHPYKPIAASDGGIIATDDKELSDYAQSYRNFGRQNTDNGYEIVGEGFKFYMNNLNATIALTQLEGYEDRRLARKEVYDVIESKDFEGHLAPHDENSSYYVATFIADTDEYAELMREKYCQARLYPPMHLQPYYNDADANLPNSDRYYKRLVNLPLTNIEAYDH